MEHTEHLYPPPDAARLPGRHAPLALTRGTRLPGLLWMALLLISCAVPAAAEWQVTPTATGFGPDPNALRQDCYREVDEWGLPLYYDPQSLHINYHVQWVGGGTPPGVQNNTIKVKLRVTGTAEAWARPYLYQGTEPPYDPWVGQCAATTTVSTSLNGGVTATAQAEGLLPWPYDPDYDVEPLDQTEIRTLTLDGNNAADTAVDISRSWSLSQDGGWAAGIADVGCVLSLSVVELVNPSWWGDPVLDGENEYCFASVTVDPGTGPQDLSYLSLPCETQARQCEGQPIQDLATTGVLEWESERSWLSPLTRLQPNGADTYSSLIFPICSNPINASGIDGLAFGRLWYLPENNSDFGLTAVSLSAAPHVNIEGDLNVEGKSTAQVELFWPAVDNHHPGEGWLSTDNWFYYYKDAVGELPGTYAFVTGGSYYNPVTGLHLGRQSARGPNDGTWGCRLFYLADTTDPAFPHGKKMASNTSLKIGGIHRYVYNVWHEYGHKVLHDSGLDGFYSEQEDRDRDGMKNGDEQARYLDPDNSDTTWGYGGLSYGDQQCLADILGYGALLPRQDIWQQDWASDGLQVGARNTSRFPWYYSVTGTSVPPSYPPGGFLQAIPVAP
ncbi:MAG: hypothetical protein HY321_07645 [Armatimonadetes bacterium]|nr:hypothetical protein [Armatimonadota bacterium]